MRIDQMWVQIIPYETDSILPDITHKWLQTPPHATHMGNSTPFEYCDISFTYVAPDPFIYATHQFTPDVLSYAAHMNDSMQILQNATHDASVGDPSTCDSSLMTDSKNLPDATLDNRYDFSGCDTWYRDTSVPFRCNSINHVWVCDSRVQTLPHTTRS